MTKRKLLPVERLYNKLSLFQRSVEYINVYQIDEKWLSDTHQRYLELRREYRKQMKAKQLEEEQKIVRCLVCQSTNLKVPVVGVIECTNCGSIMDVRVVHNERKYPKG